MVNPGEKLRVLWVEDEKIILNVFDSVLKAAGLDRIIEITHFIDGNSAIKCFDEVAPQFFITDYCHPGADGEELIAFLAERQYPGPVVYYTGPITKAHLELKKKFGKLTLEVLMKSQDEATLLGLLVMAAIRHQDEPKAGRMT